MVSGSTPDLFESFQPIPFCIDFEVFYKSWVIVTGHIDCEHRAKANTQDKAVMVAFNAQLDGQWIDGSKTGLNIYDRTDHYGICPISFSFQVNPGRHVVQFFGRSASTAAVGVDGLAEIKDGFNCITYQIFEEAADVGEN